MESATDIPPAPHRFGGLHGDIHDENCPSRAVLSHLTAKWNLLILISLRGGTLRFAELRRKIGGISERMLAKNLQQLERHRLLTRQSFPVVPPHVEYTLTPLGDAAAQRMEMLACWIEDNIATLAAPDPVADPVAGPGE